MRKLIKGLGILFVLSFVLGLVVCGGGSDDKVLSIEKIIIGIIVGFY